MRTYEDACVFLFISPLCFRQTYTTLKDSVSEECFVIIKKKINHLLNSLKYIYVKLILYFLRIFILF